jgi:phospholipid-binding lipoprotein MlaA
MKSFHPLTSLFFLSFSILFLLDAWLSAQDDFLSEDDLFDDKEFETGETIADPIEGLNRIFFGFNDFVYKNLLGPLSKGYHSITPDPLERGFSNFFDNIKYPVRLTGNLLQFKIEESFQETGKFLVNTTLGLGGFQKASVDFPKLDPPVEDIGQAFGAWGIDEGFYIVIPFLGPSNARDFVGRFADRIPDLVATPWTVLDNSTDRLIVGGVDFVTDSPTLMFRYESLTKASIDPYEAMKDSFTKYRMQLIRE